MPNLSFLQLLKDLLDYVSNPATRDEAARLFDLPAPVVAPVVAPTVPVVAPTPVVVSPVPAPVASAPTPVTPVVPVTPAPPAAPEPVAAPQAPGQTFWGGMGRDVFTGGAGDDVVDGGMGDDTLDAGAGNNFVYGGMGRDTLRVGDGNNEVDGGMGDDVITAGNGRNRLFGGMGNDRITAGNGGNFVDAGMGNDRVVTGNGDDTLFGGMGNDFLTAGGGNDTYRFDAAFGQDVIDNRDGAASSTDQVVFTQDSDIQAQQLWFRRDGADLVVEAVGKEAGKSGHVTNGINGLSFGSGDVFGGFPATNATNASAVQQREGQLTLRNWYSDPASQVDVFQDAAGRTLQKSQVDGLVSAMAGFGGAPASLASLNDTQRQQLDVVVANSWAA